MFCLYFILTLFVVAFCNQDGKWLKCKPKPGCSIARCDPIPPDRWFGDEGLDNEHPILCQQNKASSSPTAGRETVAKFDEIQRELIKLEVRHERSEREEIEMKSEMKLLEKKNAEMENEINILESEVDEEKEKMNDAIKQIDILKKENDKMEKEANESKATMDDAMKRIILLEKKIAEMEWKNGNTNEERKGNEANSLKENTGINNIREVDKKFDEIRVELAKLEGKLERSEAAEWKMKSEINFQEKKIAEMERENDITKKEMNEKIRLLRKNNAEMEKKMKKLEKDAEKSKGKADDAIKPLCPAKHDNKCFIPVIKRKVDYDGGVAICKSLGGHLANIYSQIHMDDVMKYIRENRMGGSTWKDFLLGMKYDLKANKLTFRDGTDAPAGLKWWPDYPFTEESWDGYAGYTNMILDVISDQSTTNQYLRNYPPSYETYVLCEID